MATFSIIAMLVGCGFLLFKEASMPIWLLSYAILSILVARYGAPSMLTMVLMSFFFVLLLIGTVKPIRRVWLTRYFFTLASRVMPEMSNTEREALEAGTVSFEGALFSGAPRFNQLLSMPPVSLSPDEQAFMDGPVTTLCRMIDDWDITQYRLDMPAEVWKFIKEHRFLGMIIPKAYGGLEFSATAVMSVIVKLYSCSITVATTVSVPNSLGPGELLLKYGTNAQKEYYLPRLASGIEVPCFALTGPYAGSDAAAIPDSGVVCRETINGVEVLGMRISWHKRYITLCPVATVIGLAFRLFDPDKLLGGESDIGITCALIPANTEGVVHGRRHFPLNVAFMNGPTEGHDVFVPMDNIIGGVEMAGHGWRMLMECLSAGRAISLPSSASGSAQAVSLVSGAYARIRKQFHQPIAHFEGIEEPLARIGGYTYMIDAALTMTAAAIDHGARPPVAGAIVKYHTTERMRRIVCDAMDIHGGKGICLGPNNYLGRGFQGCPIGITVEGANILSRSLIIYGQGAIRCHPYVLREMESILQHDLKGFDEALWGHVGFALSRFIKSLVYSLTNARWVRGPQKVTLRYYQSITRYSAHLAFTSDVCMAILGGALKRKELLSARLGDALSALYLASAVLKRHHDDGEPKEDLPLVHWCCQDLLYDCERAFHELIQNFPVRWVRVLLKWVIFPYGFKQHKPTDALGKNIATILTTPNLTRERLSRLAFYEDLPHCPIGRVEAAFHKICAVESLEKKVREAEKAGQLCGLTLFEQIKEAENLGILTETEAKTLHQAECARQYVIAVDDFAEGELLKKPKRS